MDISRLKFPLLVAGVGLLLGLISDLLLYDQPPGISVPIIALLVIVALLVLAFVEGVTPVWANLWLVVPLLLLAAMSAVRAAPLLRFLNISGTILLLGLLASGLATRPLIGWNLGDYIGAVFDNGILNLLIPFPLLKRSVDSLRAGGSNTGRLIRRVLVGLLIAIPFLCVFTVLFASADLIFSSYVRSVLDNFNIPDLFGHAMLTLMLGWILMGGLGYALSRNPAWRGLFSGAGAPASSPAPPSPADPETAAAAEAAPVTGSPPFRLRGLLGMLETTVVLFSIDMLFLIFVLIQLAALFGGEAFLRSRGLTYSEYARRGFFELLAVSLITLGLILTLDFLTRRENKIQRVIFLLGSGLMIGMTILILASAFQRLQLYELAYGFTTLRVYSHVFMVWLAVLFAYVLGFLTFDRSRLFATGALVAAIGFVITLDILNPDAFIVRQNVARYERGEELDVDYLGTLSEDAVPLLVPLLHRYGPEIGQQVGPWLHQHLIQLDERQQQAGWPSYHLSINRAYHLLDLNRGLIEQFDLPESWWNRYDY